MEKERKGRAYFSIQVNVNKDRCTFRWIRKDDVAITRLRLGHWAEEWAGSDWPTPRWQV